MTGDTREIMHRTHCDATGQTVENRSTDLTFYNVTKSDSRQPTPFLSVSDIDQS